MSCMSWENGLHILIKNNFNQINIEINDIEKNLYDLNQNITGVLPRFLFNLDEIGCEDSANRFMHIFCYEEKQNLIQIV